MNNPTFYHRNGTAFMPTAKANLQIDEMLPPGNYIIKQSPEGQLYFDQVGKFDNPSKLYGDVRQTASRILGTFWDRPASTGVLLGGEKGSGKTMLARQLSIMGFEQGVPTIIINAPWTGDKFNQLIQSVVQPCIIMFDEFEKTYNEEDQVHVLTLLDGVFNSKKLFILTCNDKWRIDRHMHNRPGRIFYSIDYKGIERDFIEEYCNDNLLDTSHTDAICVVASTFSAFNFDMLKALVEEMNRYNEPPHVAMKLLNVKPQSDNDGMFDITYTFNGVPITHEQASKVTHDNPIREPHLRIRVPLPVPVSAPKASNAHTLFPVSSTDEVASPSEEDEGDIDYTKIITLTGEHFRGIDPTTGGFVYKYEEYTILFTRQKPRYASNIYGAF